MAEETPSIDDFKKLTVGGSAQVKDNFLKNKDTNTANNVYLTSEAVINIATGKYAPVNDMLIYVSIEADSDVVPITGTAGKDDVKYFKSDNSAYKVEYDTDNTLINLVKIHTTHNLVKVNGQAATESASGFKDYYECKDITGACGALFEDANGTVPIENL
ncbi:MAG: hypothetical protein Q4Q25_04430, partial [Methanocorpusculum sp.]|nr:hypothetical protein [Methanocorpusculum sp.]